MTGLELQQLVEPWVQLEPGQIILTLLLAFVLGLAVAITYRVSVPGRVLSPSLQASLVLLAMVAAMVMMVIGNNLARAFSLVGALAIVRFRTRLSSPWDISFVFFSLASGIACGVQAFPVAVVGTSVVALAVLALHVVPVAGVRADRIRMLRCDVASFEGVEGRLEAILDRHTTRRWLIEGRSLRFGESLSFRYRVVLRHPEEVAAMLRDIGELEGVERVVLDHGEETPQPD